MRAAAAIPAAGIIAGAALGLLDPGLPAAPAESFFIIATAGAFYACARRYPRGLVAAATMAFMAGGALLAVRSWTDASRPPILDAFDALARVERARAAADGRPLPVEDEASATIEGVLRSDASSGASGISLTIDVDHIGGRFLDPSGGAAISVAGVLGTAAIDAWRAGRRVRLPASLRLPAHYLDPGVPDNRVALARKRISLTGTVKSAALVESVARGSMADEAIAGLRAFSRRAIASSVGRWSARSAGIVAAIVIGDRTGLDPAVQRDLQDAGTYHVIAISGGNIAILAGLMLFAFRVAGFLGRSAMLVAIASLIVYARLVGGGASVDRATLMAAVYLAARAVDHRSDPLNALAFVAAVLVALDPLTLADPAFLLTFGATFAILAFAPRLPRGRVAAWAAPAVAMLAASAATEALLLPVGAFLFSRVTFAGLALNFAAIPLMAVAQVAGMAVVPLAAVSSSVAACAGWVAHVGAAGLVWSAALVHFMPMIVFRVAAPPVAVCLAVLRSDSDRMASARISASVLALPPRAGPGCGSLSTRSGLLARSRGRTAARYVRRCRPGRCRVRQVPGRQNAADRCRRACRPGVIRHRRSRRRSGAARGARAPPRLSRPDTRRPRSRRRRRRADRSVPAARGVGRDSSAAIRAADDATAAGSARGPPLVERVSRQPGGRSTAFESEPCIPTRPTGSVRK